MFEGDLAAAIWPLTILLAVVGAVWGVAADRVSVRWPAHDEAEGFLPGRRPGWRTVVVAAFGAIGLGGVTTIFPPGTAALAFVLFEAYVVVLVLLLATDLDQRLMPDVLTLPMIPVALLYAISGQNPLVGSAWIPALVAAVVIPLLLYLPSLLFGPGAFGLGDVKLLVTVGLISGAYRAVLGTFAGIIVAGVVIVVLLVARRVTLRTYIPFGPFLILGALWAILLRT